MNINLCNWWVNNKCYDNDHDKVWWTCFLNDTRDNVNKYCPDIICNEIVEWSYVNPNDNYQTNWLDWYNYDILKQVKPN